MRSTRPPAKRADAVANRTALLDAAARVLLRDAAPLPLGLTRAQLDEAMSDPQR